MNEIINTYTDYLNEIISKYRFYGEGLPTPPPVELVHIAQLFYFDYVPASGKEGRRLIESYTNEDKDAFIEAINFTRQNLYRNHMPAYFMNPFPIPDYLNG